MVRVSAGYVKELNLDAKPPGNDSRLLEAISRNSVLKVLSLRDNQLDEGGATVLANSLLFNSTLMSLTLEHNSIGDEGARNLASSLSMPSDS